MIVILPKLNTHSDELKKLFLKPKISLKKNSGFGLVLVIIHGYQLTYYRKVNNCIGLTMFVVEVYVGSRTTNGSHLGSTVTNKNSSDAGTDWRIKAAGKAFGSFK